MSIQINTNGYSYSLVDEGSIEWLVESKFPDIFERYLITRFGVNSSQLRDILVEVAPERFL